VLGFEHVIRSQYEFHSASKFIRSLIQLSEKFMLATDKSFIRIKSIWSLTISLGFLRTVLQGRIHRVTRYFSQKTGHFHFSDTSEPFKLLWNFSVWTGIFRGGFEIFFLKTPRKLKKFHIKGDSTSTPLASSIVRQKNHIIFCIKTSKNYLKMRIFLKISTKYPISIILTKTISKLRPVARYTLEVPLRPKRRYWRIFSCIIMTMDWRLGRLLRGFPESYQWRIWHCGRLLKNHMRAKT